MNMMQFLLALRARYKVALLVLFCTVAVALAVNQYLPRQYSATAAVAFDLRSPDPVAGVILPVIVATQVEIIKSDRVARKVIRVLKLDESPAVKAQWRENADGEGNLEQWLTDSLLRGLEVLPARESNIIRISYKASDPGFAAAVANTFAQAYVETTIEMRVEPARQNSRWLEDQGKLLRENVEKAQSRLSAYQQKSGIVATDERMDDETTRLSQLSAQLTVLQEQSADARSRQKSGADTLPEVLQSPLVQSLRTDIARQEVKLKEAAGNLGRNHPQYQSMESELAELRQRLESETRHVTRSLSATTEVSSNKESELRAAIEAQRKRLLELRSARDQLAVLQRDVDAVQRIYDTVMQRYNQTSLESQTTLTNVSLFAAANEPTAPSFPKPLRSVLLLSIFLGLALGAGAVFKLEMLDRRIRCVDDLAEMLQMPVLGVMKRDKTRGRLALLHRRAPLALR
jgi:succinoglycan biosynthesis transport protein ExoP